jgi:hypothetical protein
MFTLETQSVFFEGLAEEHPMLIQNIEIVFDNNMSLDDYYHKPKQFILHLNNTIRAITFFVEFSSKNTPSWFKSCVEEFRINNSSDYEMIKRIRDISNHQALIFPKESIVAGLFRIRSSTDYLPKIGFGDFNNSSDYGWDMAMKNTQDIFHDLLTFHSITFMDLEHSEPGECLGLARRWFYRIKHRKSKLDETVDVYKLVNDFSMKLLDHVCQSYATHIGLRYDFQFYKKLEEFNFINTLLEIDLYPTLFSRWWEGEVKPMNWGVSVDKSKGELIQGLDSLYSEYYEKLCDSPESYKALLDKYTSLSFEDYFIKDNFDEFQSFIHLNHWHYKKSFGGGLSTPIPPNEIMMLQRLGKMFITEYKKEKLCTIVSTGKKFKDHLSMIAMKV